MPQKTRPDSGDRRMSDLLVERLKAEQDDISRWRKAGGMVLGYTCHAFPPALAAGLGLRPLRLLFGATPYAESAGERAVRPDVCPHVKSLLGNLLNRTGLHAEVDMMAALFTCDQMRRGYSVIAEADGPEVHPIQLPATRTPESASYYASQVGRMAKDIMEGHGLLFDPVRALRWRDARREAADVLARASRSFGVAPLDLHLMYHVFFIARPEGLGEFFGEAIRAFGPFEAERRVLVVGGPLALEDTALLEALEAREVGVLPLNCTGLNTVEHDDMPEALAGLSEWSPEALALEAFYLPPCARARPNTGVYERISHALKSTGASGVIIKALKFCDHWYAERKRMATSLDVPVMYIDTAYSEGERERVEARVEAFVDMIDKTPSGV